jgi:hypothetical protein
LGLPVGASCNFSPTPLIPTGAVTSATLTITTAAERAGLPGRSPLSLPGSALALAFCCFGWKRRRGYQLFLLAAIAAGLSLCTGCGANTVVTAPATSTISVIATDGTTQPAASFALTVM